MELQQLRSLYHLAREGSFTGAARRLFVTQSAVSQQIRALEDDVGQQLVERTRGGARLTPAGQSLCRRAATILDEVRLAREEIEAQAEIVGGRVVTATSDTNCTYVLPAILERFCADYPRVEVDVRNKMSSEIAPLVLADEIDFGLATLPVTHRHLDTEPLFERRDVWICPPDHPLGGRRRVNAATVADHALLTLERGSQSRAAFDALFQRAGAVPRIAMELGSIEVLKRFVEIGLGMALVPAIAVRREVEAQTLVALQASDVGRRRVGLVRRRARVPTPAAAALLAMMRDALEGDRI